MSYVAFGDAPLVIRDGQLICPRCNGEWIHQRNTTVFARDEDDETTTVLTQDGLDGQVVKFPSQDTCNPSPRRQGIVIEFDCEDCHHSAVDYGNRHTAPPLFRLALIQHKGNTYVEWLNGINS
jgi:hypothetical protein